MVLVNGESHLVDFLADAGAPGRLHSAGCRHASTLLGVSRLAFPDLLVEIDATAVA